MVYPDCNVVAGMVAAHDAPPLAVQVASAVQDRPDTTGSRSTELEASDGPLLATVTVYAVVLPATSVLVPLVLLMEIFATPRTASASDALLLPGLLSVMPPGS